MNGRAQRQCVHELIEAQTGRTPDLVAARSGDKILTYAELNRRANQLSQHLLRMGVKQESRVGIYLDRSLELVTALVAVLKAGGAYVPIDPAYPPDRIAFMIQDSGAKVLLTRHLLAAGVSHDDRKVVCVDSDWTQISLECDQNPAARASGRNLCYVIYTSGSTGRPKGIQIQHQALVNFLTSMQQRPGLAPEDVILAVTTISFDIAALEIFLPLVTGASIVIVSRDDAADGVRLIEELSRAQATVLQATPATWRLLLSAGWQGDARLRMLCGGEPLSSDLAAELLRRGASLWNMYGPTETTVWSTVHEVAPGDQRISIGRAIAHTQTLVLSDRLDPLQPGEVGELYIGGDGIARGYQNRPEITAEKFIPNGFIEEPGARLYRTGDLARVLPGGDLECLGRIDHQVKVRGFRIEPGEIEASLLRHPAVRDAVVVAREANAGNRELVAYLALKGPGAFLSSHAAASELRRFLSQNLPEYMVPSAFVEIPAIPLTPNGKLDRHALPPPDHSRAGPDRPKVGPRDPLEHQLIGICEEILDIRPIGVEDNFFDLGGNSLIAARLMEQIERACGVRLSVNLLHTGATIEYLASTLLQGSNGMLHSPLIEIQSGGSREPFFFLHGDFNGGGFYCRDLARHLGADQPFYTLPPHGADGESLPRTIEETAARHLDTLRSFRPNGPYFLGGFCNGALVAFEIARRLQQQGATVGLLVLIYASADNVRFRLPGSLIDFIGSIRRLKSEDRRDRFLAFRKHVLRAESRVSSYVARLDELARSGVGEQARFIKRVARRYLERLIETGARNGDHEFSRDASVRASGQQSKTPHEEPRQHQRVFRPDVATAYDKLMDSYIPRTYQGRITLLWPEEAIAELQGDPTAGWGRVARRGVDVHIVAGRHLTCITRHVDVLADHLKKCLLEAQGELP